MNSFNESSLHRIGQQNSTLSMKEDLHASDIAMFTLFIIIAVLGSIGNLCILTSIYSNCSLRRITHILIMNQSLSDFLLSALSIPLRMLRISVKKQVFESNILSSDMFCRIASGSSAAVLGTSLYGLAIMTVDKFLAVKRPLAYRARMRIKHMSVPIIGSWLIPLVFCICGVFIPALREDLHNHEHDVACIISSTFDKLFVLIAYTVMQILPLVLMCPLYIYIIVKVKRSWRPPLPTSAAACIHAHSRRIVHAETQRRKESKLMNGILLTLGIHILCLTPIVLLDLVHIVGHMDIPHMLDEVFLLILYLNAVLDPLIYTRQSRDIKYTMIRMFGHYCQCGHHVVEVQGDSAWRRRANRSALKKVQHMTAVRNMTPTLSYYNDAYVLSTTISGL